VYAITVTFLQPLVTYTTPTAWSIALQTASTRDWEREQWNIPLGWFVSKVTHTCLLLP
jgi:hypothetical protein